MEAAGYNIKQILRSTENSELLLAFENETLLPVVLKYSKENFSSETDKQKLLNEFSLLQRLNHRSIIRARALEVIGGKTCLVREYFDGISLEVFLSHKPIELEVFLPLAIELCDALNTLHEAGIVHRNLSPSCILIDPSGQRIKLMGFGHVAGFIAGESSENLILLEGANVYKAPEQSGRLKHPVDHKADIYALGTIFYQMLSGRLPFASADPIGLVHSLIAKEAPPLAEISPEIPVLVSYIVSKMMAKSPSERYAQLVSLSADLKSCLQSLDQNKNITEFDIDRIGKASQFDFTGKIYGRENEIEQLFGALELTAKGRAGMIGVSGDAGVGKSTLIGTMLKQAQGKTGYSVRAKFDQYKQNAPFEILYLALRDLVKQILGEDENTLQFWKKRLLNALDSQGQVLIEVIPELEIIIGPQPAAEILSSSDTKTRLNSLLCRFVQVFSLSERPLCLFMDDMQWADVSTLEWLKMALFDLSYLCVIVAYRANEVYEGNPFYIFLKEIEGLDVDFEQICLDAMSKESINRLLHDNMHLEGIEEVTDIIFQKTRGNAFFVVHYLKELQKNNILWFDPEDMHWHCEVEKLRELPVSENVVVFLSQRIVSLPQEVQTLLKMASCIGNRFDEELLKRVYNADEDFSFSVSVALREGWIIKEAENTQVRYYFFAHDRMQQAVRSLLNPDEIEAIHLAIGHAILEEHPFPEYQELFDCANHLNEALSLLNTQEERQFLAELNQKASLQAKKSGDFALALVYIQKAMELFSDFTDGKEQGNVLRERAECEHLCNNKEAAVIYYNLALEAAASRLEKAFVYELLIKFYTDNSDFKTAYATGRVATELLNMRLPAQFNPVMLITDFARLKFRLRGYETSELLDLPEAEDENVKMLIRLLSAILKVAYQIRPELSVAISIKLVSLCLTYGNTREAVVGYMVFGVIFQGGVLGRHKTGYAYAELSLAMLERFNNTMQRAEVQFVCGYFANSWKHPSANTEKNWHLAYAHGIQIGDWFHTGCAAAGIVQSMFMRGVACERLLEEIERFEVTLKRIGANEQKGAVEGVKQAILNLRGETQSPLSFSSADFDEGLFVETLSSYGSRHFAHYYFINKMTSLYLHRAYEHAMKTSYQSKKFLSDSTGMLHSTEHHFYQALTAAKLYPSASVLTRRGYLKIVTKARKRFSVWAEECPENFLARTMILEGELHRLYKHTSKALQCYESAVQTARIYAQLNLQAIANTLAADLYTSIGQFKAATLYRKSAALAFEKWGVLDQNERSEVQGDIVDSGSDFDVRTLMKAAEVISKEQQLPNLLKTLIRIIIENAGAQHGVLLLQESTGLRVQARASADIEFVNVMQQKPYLECETITHAIINYVLRSGEAIILDNAQDNAVFGQDESVIKRKVKSVLCAPLMFHGEIRGIIYLENNLTSGVFTEERLELLKHLSGHIAISIENALVYDHLTQKVSERTRDVDAKNDELKIQNIELQNQNDKILELHSLIVKENEERKRVEEKLQEAVGQLNLLATTDALTGLHNRRSFDQYLQQECGRLSRNMEPLAFILCDVDFFKAYNDCYGHQKGDECLKQVAEVLLASVKRPADFVARYGGEEFALIMPKTDKEGALQITETIHQKLKNLCLPHAESNISDHVTISIGLVMSDAVHHCTPESIVKAADIALYRAKYSGRNTTVSNTGS